MSSINYGVIIQARMSSTRAPSKVAYKILGKEMLFHQIKRLQNNGIENVFVASSLKPDDAEVAEIAKKCGVETFRGSLDNVLERYIMAAKNFSVENIIRVGGDDPLIDPCCIKSLIQAHKNQRADFIYASHKYGWIYGTAAELVECSALEKAQRLAVSKSDKEHVVTFIRNNNAFPQYRISPEKKELIRPDIYFSVDYSQDIELITEVLTYFAKKNKLYSFSQFDLVKLYDSSQLNINNKNLHDGFDE